ncbi:olfactory receptor 6N1-like [Spea bombifrons]|uniref:olfactory receptor 6N1-like n=1 Tax=Spea bombifrons TaxID=233779 RepID=UPI0023498100|nr:olfactory receptor 6N1-like [Spea bombifrons]
MYINHSIEGFIIVGFTNMNQYHKILFTPVVFLYIFIVLCNAVTSFAIFYEPRLHTPMYFLIGVLSVIEILIVTTGYPNLFAIVLVGNSYISFNNCLLQMYVFHSLLITENCLLNVMAYDRYLAIGNPLRYHSIMTFKFCKILIFGCWVFGFATPLGLLILVSRMPFCGPNEIRHLVCDSSPLLTLSCANNTLNVIVDLIISSFTLILTFVSVVITYIRILVRIMKMKTTEERKKAFSICASHLIMAVVFYGSVAFMYVQLQINYSTEYDLATAIHHFVLAPFFTPLIYGFRSREMRNFIIKCTRQKRRFSRNVRISSVLRS